MVHRLEIPVQRIDPNHPVDVVICLGCGLSPDGKRLSRQSLSIVRRGIRLYNAGLTKHILVSGGVDSHPGITVADAMRNYINDRLRNAAVIMERNSGDTLESAAEILRIAHRHSEWRSVAIVTHPWHARRAQAIFRYVWRNADIRIIVIKARSPYGGNCRKRFRHFASFLVWDLFGWSAFWIRRLG